MKGSEWSVMEFLATGLSTFSVDLCIKSKNITQDGNQKGVGDVSVVIKYVQLIHTMTNNNEGVECGEVWAGRGRSMKIEKKKLV